MSVVQLHSLVTENHNQLSYLPVENQGFQAKISHRTKKQSRSVSSSVEQKDNTVHNNYFQVVVLFDKYLLFSRTGNKASLENCSLFAFTYFEEKI